MSEQEEDKSQKTEQPTAHKLDKARKDGQVTLSKEVGHWFMLQGYAVDSPNSVHRPYSL